MTSEFDSFSESSHHAFRESSHKARMSGPAEPTYASVWKIANDGTLIWKADTGADAWDVAVDSNGNVAVCGKRNNTAGTGFKTVWVFDPAGALLWSYDTGLCSYSIMGAIEFDSNDDLIVHGYPLSSLETTHKIDGTTHLLVWSTPTANKYAHWSLQTFDVAIDSNDDVVIAGGYHTGTMDNVWKIDGATGAVIWDTAPDVTSMPHSTYAVEVDNNDDPHLIQISLAGDLIKFNAAGAKQWQWQPWARPRKIAFDNANQLAYLSWRYAPGGDSVTQYDTSSGKPWSEIWHAGRDAEGKGLARCQATDIVVASTHVQRIDVNGTLQAEYGDEVAETRFQGVACDANGIMYASGRRVVQ